MKKTKYTFKRWFMHWCAFQIIALKLNCWKISFLLHDIDKPFNIFLLNDEELAIRHKRKSKHHVEYYNNNKYDYVGMIVDWECSRITKPEASLNARETFNVLYRNKVSPTFDKNIELLLNKFKLN